MISVELALPFFFGKKGGSPTCRCLEQHQLPSSLVFRVYVDLPSCLKSNKEQHEMVLNHDVAWRCSAGLWPKRQSLCARSWGWGWRLPRPLAQAVGRVSGWLTVRVSGR